MTDVPFNVVNMDRSGTLDLWFCGTALGAESAHHPRWPGHHRLPTATGRRWWLCHADHVTVTAGDVAWTLLPFVPAMTAW
jgi:hypothetical protein